MTTPLEQQLHRVARRLFADDVVKLIIGYGQMPDNGPTYPVFITSSDDVEQLVWNDRCYANLTSFLKRKEIRALGKCAIIVKGCDERALVVLEQESQLTRDGLYVIGIPCTGMLDPDNANSTLPKCKKCSVHVTRFANEIVGETAEAAAVATTTDDPELEAFMAKTPAERWAYWMNEFERCIKCYACREVCPMCYCPRCIADKNRPQIIDTSATLKGNLAWNITRAFHLAGRCIECDECTRACPANINLRLLNQSLARSARDHFEYQAGMNPETPPIIGAYSLQDKEDFIR